MRLRLANQGVQVLGLVIDADRCGFVTAGLRRPVARRAARIPDARTDPELIDARRPRQGRQRAIVSGVVPENLATPAIRGAFGPSISYP